MTKNYTYIRPQNLKDIADEIRKIIEHKKYEELETLVTHIDLYIKGGLDIFSEEEVYENIYELGEIDEY